jgi:acetyl-CoA carboxylase biotin carboxyl carrier protein
MDIREIKKIVEMMKENDLTEFEMEDQGFRLGVKRRGAGDAPTVVYSAAPSPAAAPPPAPAAVPAATPAAEEDADLVAIKSPIVGTAYRAASPDADPFVSVGSEVSEETVVCIVEAMKVMNEIKAETRGIIRKILIENATPVQFGQPLFKVEPL